MKKALLNITILLIFPTLLFGQTLDANATMGLPRITNLTDITGTPTEGNIVYVTSDDRIYRYDGANWIADVGTDDQDASEVNTVLSSSIDLNGDGTVNNADIIDVDGDNIIDTTLQNVVEAITPITSKAGRVFYPPSIEIDVSALTPSGAPDETVDLYQQYVNQYDISLNTTTINGVTVNYQTAKSTSAPNNIPLYTANELYYYVTFADANVFDITGISDAGILSYRIVGQPADFNTLINVVFVVK
ncbi:hypothetical protein [Aquimarina agarivorans]|uniref:hypothetical protein n=1 Tax=Aquimarina agarivorans TaxID=980584 RepID=UPI000248F591|nr:hypothetical protein [Aquimarina agarivorans]